MKVLLSQFMVVYTQQAKPNEGKAGNTIIFVLENMELLIPDSKYSSECTQDAIIMYKYM